MKYLPHPLAELFPVISAAEMTTLFKSIKQLGLLSPITLYEGRILDGRHRYEACDLADVEPRFVEYEGDDPVGFVIAANIERRHLTTSQRAMLAAKLTAENKRGGDRQSEDGKQVANLQLTRAEAAKTLGVSPRSVAKAAKVLKASPALAKQVSEGEISVAKAVKKVEAKAAAKAGEPETRLDAVGRVIPPALLEDWDRAKTMAAQLRSCASEIKVTVERGFADGDIIYNELDRQTHTEAATLHYTLGAIAPHAVCPECQGKLRKNCQLCRRRGFISKALFNSPATQTAIKVMLERMAANNV